MIPIIILDEIRGFDSRPLLLHAADQLSGGRVHLEALQLAGQDPGRAGVRPVYPHDLRALTVDDAQLERAQAVAEVAHPPARSSWNVM